jgi:hypothetical protein
MKNPKLENLRVAVVPTETGNGIDQSSTVQEIINCPDTRWFSVPDYFQAQNDEELDLLHWSFLIDYKTKEHCNGMNVDGIDYNSREQNIAYIKRVLTEWGETTACDLELDSSPCLYSVGTNKLNVCELVEEFRPNGVSTVTYQNEMDLGYTDYLYSELSDEVLEEIVSVMEDYEAECLQTEKRCSD